MLNKDRLRKKFFSIRKRNYYDVNSNFFNPLSKLIKSQKKNNNYISIYYPSNYEVNCLKLFETNYLKKTKILLPVIKANNKMKFFKWEKNDVLKINKFGMLEPAIYFHHIVPEIMLVPLLAFDNNRFRLGYGGGFYDRYLNKYLTNHKKILTIGIAFSFQKYHKLPVNDKDVKLDYILTEKGIF